MTEVIFPDDVLMENFAALLDEGWEVCFTPKGDSMRPFLEGGRDSVVLRKNAVVEIGDVVLARLGNGQYVLHRVIGKSGEELMLMGDGNLHGTECVLVCNVLGTMVTIVKPDGKNVRPTKGKVWFRLLPFRKHLLWIYRKKLKLGI